MITQQSTTNKGDNVTTIISGTKFARAIEAARMVASVEWQMGNRAIMTVEAFAKLPIVTRTAREKRPAMLAAMTEAGNAWKRTEAAVTVTVAITEAVTSEPDPGAVTVAAESIAVASEPVITEAATETVAVTSEAAVTEIAAEAVTSEPAAEPVIAESTTLATEAATVTEAAIAESTTLATDGAAITIAEIEDIGTPMTNCDAALTILGGILDRNDIEIELRASIGRAVQHVATVIGLLTHPVPVTPATPVSAAPPADGKGALTPRQAEGLKFYRAFEAKHGKAPTQKEFAEGMGIKSLGAAHAHIASLREKGYLPPSTRSPRTTAA